MYEAGNVPDGNFYAVGGGLYVLELLAKMTLCNLVY